MVDNKIALILGFIFLRGGGGSFFFKKKLSGRGTSILDLRVAQDMIIFDIFDLTLSFISKITYLVKQLTLISSTR